MVLPPIFIMHLQSLVISRLLNGRTRTATFTEDIFAFDDYLECKENLKKLTQKYKTLINPFEPTQFTDYLAYVGRMFTLS